MNGRMQLLMLTSQKIRFDTYVISNPSLAQDRLNEVKREISLNNKIIMMRFLFSVEMTQGVFMQYYKIKKASQVLFVTLLSSTKSCNVSILYFKDLCFESIFYLNSLTLKNTIRFRLNLFYFLF